MVETVALRTSPVRVLGLLIGDVKAAGSAAQIKYGQLFKQLATQSGLVDIHDVDVRGFRRYENAARSFQWSKHRWRETFYKNAWIYNQRSYLARQIIKQYQSKVDVVLQHGALFSAYAGADAPPMIMYTDFTYRLAQREDPWRDPFRTEKQREQWNNLEGQAYLHAAYVLTRSEYTRQSLINDYGVAPERVAVVGGGINFEVLPPTKPLPDVPRVLFIGRDFERKGGAPLLAAFARVRETLPEAELWVVTSKVDVEGPGIRRIEPTYRREEITELYNSASVFAMPSQCETWGDVFLEAMAHGLPCVGSFTDAMPEIIQHGETGFLVMPNDVDELAQYLTVLLRNAALRQHMGEKGRERVNQLFTWEHVVQRMLPYLEAAQTQ